MSFDAFGFVFVCKLCAEDDQIARCCEYVCLCLLENTKTNKHINALHDTIYVFTVVDATAVVQFRSGLVRIVLHCIVVNQIFGNSEH